MAGWPATAAAQTVGDHVAEGCWTGVVRGLTDQLIGEINCLAPGSLETFEEGEQLEFATSAVVPALQQAAVADLAAALAERPGAALTLNSALRSLPQQYLLYQWYGSGRCGIQIAARPGHSNHEGGLAIDVDDHAAWRDALEQHGWQWYGADDVVHFTYVASGDDIRSASVLAFQALWNVNHPEDPIAEDGLYGDETERRLGRAPADGFDIASSCEPCASGTRARFDRAVAPREVVIGQAVDVAATFTNVGVATWVAGRVVLDGERPVSIERDVIAGDSVTLVGRWTVPSEGARTLPLVLVDQEGEPLEAGCDGAADGAVEVTGVERLSPLDPDGTDDEPPTHVDEEPTVDDDPSGDPPAEDPPRGRVRSSMSSGCAFAGEDPSAGTWWLGLVALQYCARRRRSSTR